MTESSRARVYDFVVREKIWFTVLLASAEDVDLLGSYAVLSSLVSKAPHRADKEGLRPRTLLLDGNPNSLVRYPHKAVVGGDDKSLAIAAASVVAKHRRDLYMRSLSLEWPNYRWEKNKGYPTAQHIQAVEEHGVTPYHRLSTRPIKRSLAAL